MRHAIQGTSSFMYIAGKKRQKDLYSSCPKAHRESSRTARTWAPQPYKDVHKEPLSAHQTSPCLILSYVIYHHSPYVECSSVLHPHEIHSLTRSRARTPACSPNSTFPYCHSVATALFSHTQT